MINRIKLAFFDEIADIGNLENRRAVGCQQKRNPGDKPVEVCDMGKNVIGDNEIGLAVGRFDDLRRVARKKTLHDIEIRCPCGRARTRRRINAQSRHSRLAENAEHAAIIAADLDNQALRPQLQFGDGAPCCLGKVPDQ